MFYCAVLVHIITSVACASGITTQMGSCQLPAMLVSRSQWLHVNHGTARFLNSCRPSIVFTSLALFGILIAPLNALPWVINGMVEALVSLRRLQQYLVVAARHADWAQPAALQPPGHAAEDTDYCDRGVAIQLCKATYRWRLVCLTQSNNIQM